jgi:hypothetical protein
VRKGFRHTERYGRAVLQACVREVQRPVASAAGLPMLGGMADVDRLVAGAVALGEAQERRARTRQADLGEPGSFSLRSRAPSQDTVLKDAWLTPEPFMKR